MVAMEVEVTACKWYKKKVFYIKTNSAYDAELVLLLSQREKIPTSIRGEGRKLLEKLEA